MSLLQPDMKSIKLAVPPDPAFDIVRDLDGIVTEVADPQGSYRYKRDDVSVEFQATGEFLSGSTDGADVEVFRAVNVKP